MRQSSAAQPTARHASAVTNGWSASPTVTASAPELAGACDGQP